MSWNKLTSLPGQTAAFNLDGSIVAVLDPKLTRTVIVYQVLPRNNEWVQRGKSIPVSTDAFAVALSGDGKTCVISNPTTTYVYTYSASQWVPYGNPIETPVGAIALSSDASTLAIGYRVEWNNQFIQLYTYDKLLSDWTLQSRVAGFYPALSSDGTTLSSGSILIGTSQTSVYRRIADTWDWQLLGSPFPDFYISDINSDGNQLILGGGYSIVYMYDSSANIWTQKGTLRFSNSVMVSISGDGSVAAKAAIYQGCKVYNYTGRGDIQWDVAYDFGEVSTFIKLASSGKTLAIRMGNAIEIWNNPTTTVITTPSNEITTVFGVDPSTIKIDATSNSPAPLLYYSSNQAIASVNDEGIVTVYQPGNVVITISQNRIYGYTAASTAIALNVLTQTQINVNNITTTWEGTPVNIPLNATSNNPSSFAYVSSDPTIATVDNSGLVTILSTGHSSIYITQPQTTSYSSGSGVASVNSLIPTVIVTPYLNNTITKLYVPDPIVSVEINTQMNTFQLEASTNNDQTSFQYASSNTEVATVDETGLVTIHSIGDAILTISQNETADYAGGYANIQLYVVDKYQTVIETPYPDNTIDKILGDADFELIVTSNNPSPFVFNSDNQSVARIDSATGMVTLVGEGRAELTIHQDATAQYTEGNLTVTLNVTVEIITVITSSFPSVINVSYGAQVFNLNAASNSPAPLQYNSTDANIALVDEVGNVTPLEVGQTILSIHQNAFENYTEATLYLTLNVLRIDTVIVTPYVDNTIYKVNGDAPFQLTVSSNSDAPFYYSSSDTNVAMINSDGLVVIRNLGKTYLNIRQPETAHYTACEVNVLLDVFENAPDNQIIIMDANGTDQYVISFPLMRFKVTGYKV